MIPLISGVLLLVFLTSSPGIEAADSKMNRAAQDLARHLAPTVPATKANPADLVNLRQRMIVLIDALEASSRTNGPGPESLLTKAYDFREDVAGVEQLLPRNAILNAWREANGRGLFNEAGKFSGDITKGRGAGGSCVFELVAKHEGEVIAFIGTDQRLTEFGNPAAENSPLAGLPAF